MNLNKAIIVGRLTREPETRALPSGQQVTSFSLATNRFWTNKDTKEKKEQTEFHNIVLFGRLAEIASQYLTKGAMAMVEGRIQTRSWEDSSGVKKYRTEIVGENLQLGPRDGQTGTVNFNPQDKNNRNKKQPDIQEDIPIIEEGEEEIDVKDIPF